MRLNKFLALGTELSRRKADEVVAAGEILINGDRAEVGMDIEPGKDVVEWRGEKIDIRDEMIVWALNKPVGYEVSRQPFGRVRTVYELVPPNLRDLNYMGRLDIGTSGLLIFTNDGDLIEQLTHPRFGHEKEYLVESRYPIEIGEVTQLGKGFDLEDGWAQAKEVIMDGSKVIHLVITEGRKRIVRRMCEKVGITVDVLRRVRIGRLSLAELNLREGEGRILRGEEIEKLKK